LPVQSGWQHAATATQTPTTPGVWQKPARVCASPESRSTAEATHVGKSLSPQSASDEQGDEQLRTRLLPQIVVPSGTWKQSVQRSGQTSSQARQTPTWQLGASPCSEQLPHCNGAPQPSVVGPHCTPASAQVFSTQGSHCCPRHPSPAPQDWQGAPLLPHAPLVVPGWQLPSAAQQPFGQVCGVQVEAHCPFALQTNAPGHVPQLPPHPSGPHTLPAQLGWQQGVTQKLLPAHCVWPGTLTPSTQTAPGKPMFRQSASVLQAAWTSPPAQKGCPVRET
jgi:hypothetical protein